MKIKCIQEKDRDVSIDFSMDYVLNRYFPYDNYEKSFFMLLFIEIDVPHSNCTQNFEYIASYIVCPTKRPTKFEIYSIHTSKKKLRCISFSKFH